MQIKDLIQNYKNIANAKENTKEIFSLYLLSRGVLQGTDKELVLQKFLKAFTPVTNANKLANGRYQYDTLQDMLRVPVGHYAKDYAIKRCVSRLEKFGFEKEECESFALRLYDYQQSMSELLENFLKEYKMKNAA